MKNIVLLVWFHSATISILAPGASSSQAAFLVRDLNVTASNANGVERFDPAVVEGQLFYAASDPRFGTEPWVSDGTPAGTRMLRDLCPGSCGSDPLDFTVVGGRLFFSADDGVFGREPWASDGTPEGTQLLRDTMSGAAGSHDFALEDYAAVGDRLFFVAHSITHLSEFVVSERLELWTSDGTRRGTVRLASCEDCGNPELWSGTDSRLYLLLRPRRHSAPSGLWTSDGTPAGTRALLPVCDSCQFLGNVGDQLFFRRDDRHHGTETWVSDGTPEGTRLLADTCPGGCSGNPLDFLEIEGRIFFTALDTDTRRFSRSLFESDGTPEGTRRVLDSRGGSLIGVFNAAPWRDEIYFSSFDRRFVQGRLFRFDPDGGGLELVRSGFSGIDALAGTGGPLFLVDSGPGADRLWASDGTRRGTLPVSPPFAVANDRYRAGIRGLGPGGKGAFFLAYSREQGWELWASDGTAAATRRLFDAGLDPGSSQPRRFARLSDRLVLVADPDGETSAVFQTDGSFEGTLPLGIGPEAPLEFGRLGGELIYSASVERFSSSETIGLWRSDATFPGTVLLDVMLFNAAGFTELEGRVLFSAETFSPGLGTGAELWASDGTPSGTGLVRDINPGIQPSDVLPCCGNSSSPHELTRLGSEVLFAAADADFGNNVELWKSDGTEEGTVKVAEICPDPVSAEDYETIGRRGSNPSDLTPWAGKVFFAADDGRVGRELWVSDGSTQGTERVTDLGLTAAGSSPHGLFVLGGRLYFFARRGRGESLWSTDGTMEGTELVHSLVYRRNVSRVISRHLVGERVYFVAANEAIGPELWTSDGTAEGTGLVADLRPGRLGSYPESLASLGELLVFAADDGRSGREVWASDGTAEGTRLLADVVAGPGSSDPADFYLVGSLLYFSASTPGEGRELWAVEYRSDPAGSGPSGLADARSTNR